MFVQKVSVVFHRQRFSYSSVTSTVNYRKIVSTFFMLVLGNFGILGPANQMLLHSSSKMPARLSDIATRTLHAFETVHDIRREMRRDLVFVGENVFGFISIKDFS